MKRVTGIGGIFFKAEDPQRCTSGMKNIWESRLPLMEPVQLSSGAKSMNRKRRA